MESKPDDMESHLNCKHYSELKRDVSKTFDYFSNKIESVQQFKWASLRFRFYCTITKGGLVFQVGAISQKYA